MNIFNFLRYYDFKIYYFLFSFDSSNLWHFIFYFFARFGIILFLISFIYLTLKKKIRALICVLMAMGIAGTADFLVFIFWQRPRPFESHSDIVFRDMSGLYSSMSSFPSSHTYIAFAIATSVLLYGHKKLGSLLLLLAMMVAIGRIGIGLHYPSDVIGGVIFGIAAGFLVYKICINWEKKSNTG